MNSFINPIQEYQVGDVLLNTQQVCKLLGITRQTVQRLANNRQITRFKLSETCYRYSQNSINAYLNRER